MKYAIANIDRKKGIISTEGVYWRESTLEDAKNFIQNDDSKCALFFHRDVEGLGYPINKEATREQFEHNPIVFGICYYHAWSGYAFE